MSNINGPAYEMDSRETNFNPLSEDEIQGIEDKRLAALEEAGIDESEVIAEIHRNMGTWQTYFQENNTNGRTDLEFLYREQWTAIEQGEFTNHFKPCLTINKCYDAYRKIIGEQRNNTPQLKVSSVTGKASDESLKLTSDMLKRIAYSSKSKEVYQNCFQSALSFSYGALLVDIEYESSDSFNQDIIYRWMPEPEKCFWDPRAIDCHKGDGNFCGYYTSISYEEYDARYPNAPHPTSFSDPQTMTQFQWVTRDRIVICNYFVKEYYTKILYELGNGDVVTQEEFEELKKLHKKSLKHIDSAIPEGFPEHEEANRFIVGLIPPMFEVIRERVTSDYRIMHYEATADKILDFEAWPSRLIPLVFWAGDKYYKEGQEYTRTFINQAKDAQRIINYVACEIVAQIKNSTRGQWIGTPANVKGPGLDAQWRNPELQTGLLLADPDPQTGLPQKTPPSEIPQSLLIYYERATRDLKEVLGVYNMQLDGNGAEDSGIAIRNRDIQSSGSAEVFFDNGKRAIEQCGRITLDMFPNVYDTERNLTLTRANGDQYTVTINQKMEDGSVKNAIEKSDFDIELDAGPSFAVQKQEALTVLVQLVQANPQVFPLVADLIAKNLDLQFSHQLVERFKTMVPPAVLAKEEGKELPPEGPKPEEIMMQKQMELADAKLEEQKHELRVREQKLVIEQERAELEKAQMLLDLQELQHKMRESEARDTTENRKATLNYSATIARIIAGVNKNNKT